ncbi:Hsp20/alpha crystallin family protein [Thalassobellus suaedae]|uniref:Hsp20/alpha crystallin family protein n=1 Tax=Thalassobellus suaedae TaxID=3074124 RepID=A0ABY9XPR8_9FLAO|nr:Hsp20/alpha crystallin family protein [Flavobacteriaceae bacterium HL-DH14]WNH13116.1 Hsp20/alpha crystallin family protein [Flavobacteriaceae bacterium HL-DH10]
MSLVKFRNKRRPLETLTTRDFFNADDFLGNRFWNSSLFLDDFWNGKSNEPALNIIEEDDKFEIELSAPGFSKNDFEVTVDNGYLNISAEKTDSKKEKEDNYTRKEFSYNSFEKRLLLPDSVKEEDVKAKYKDGILRFNLTKKEEAKQNKPKKIEIA